MYQRQPNFETDLNQASDASSDEKTLQAILGRHYGEIAIAEAIAKNPACPYRLFTLFWKYMQNIAVLNPNLATYQANAHWHRDVNNGPQIHYSKWSSNVSKSQPEAYKVKFILEHGNGEYQRHVMSLKHIPENFIREYATCKSAPLRKVIAARHDLPADLFTTLTQDSAKSVRLALATNPQTPVGAVAVLAQDNDSDVATAAQAHPHCPDEAIHQARIMASNQSSTNIESLDSLNFSQLSELAYSESTDTETLAKLADHEDPCIRFVVGINKNSSVNLLQKIAEDEVDWVRAAAAFNINTPTSALQRLLSSKLSDIQVGLASNPRLTEADQIKLAGTASEHAAYALANLTQYDSVREKLVENLPPAKSTKSKSWRHHLHETLAERKSGKFAKLQKGRDTRHLFVAKIAARSQSCPDTLAAHYAFYCFEDYAQNPKAALALLEGKTHVKPEAYKDWKVDMWLTDREVPGFVGRYFLYSDNAKRRSQTVSSWTTQIVDLLPFVFDGDTNTRKRVAERPDLIRFMFEILARDEKPSVREQISLNKKTPKSVLEFMANDKATTVRVQVSKRATKNSSLVVSDTPIVNQGSATERGRLARTTKDTKILAELATDRATSVRLQVAENSETPDEILMKLANDKEEKIRAIVARCVKDEITRKSLLKDKEKSVRVQAAKNRQWYHYNDGRHYDKHFLDSIAHAEDDELRALVAEFTTDAELIAHYMQDLPLVTRSLCKNPLLVDDDKIKFAKLTGDQDTLAALACRTPNEELFLISARKITSSHADDPIRCHREMLARPRVQDELCTHPLLSVRHALTHQKKLTEHAKKVLAEDENAQIRQAILKR